MARFEPKKVAPIDRNHWHKSNRYIQIPATISRNIDGEVVESPIKEGNYHFIVYCTDDSGQESFVSTEIHISYDAEEHDHH